MTLNPIKIYRQWRNRKEEQRERELRCLSIDLASRFGDPLQVNLYRAHIIYLYIKYGIAEDGVSVDEIFNKKEFTEEYKYKYPDRPIRL